VTIERLGRTAVLKKTRQGLQALCFFSQKYKRFSCEYFPLIATDAGSSSAMDIDEGQPEKPYPSTVALPNAPSMSGQKFVKNKSNNGEYDYSPFTKLFQKLS